MTNLEKSDLNITGLFFKDIEPYPTLSDETQNEYLKEFSNGNYEHLDHFLCSNIRLCIWQAKKYYKTLETCAVIDLLDLIQEGFIGLREAALRYSIGGEAAFSTYATFWIKQKILRYIDNNQSAIRIPVHALSAYKKVMRLLKDDIEMDVNDACFKIGIEPKSFRKVYLLSNIHSLDWEINDEDDSVVGDFVSDEKTCFEDEVINQLAYLEILDIMKNKLTKREFDVLSRRMGMNSTNTTETLEEIAKTLNVTRERIRQIESKALEKIQKQYQIIARQDYNEKQEI